MNFSDRVDLKSDYDLTIRTLAAAFERSIKLMLATYRQHRIACLSFLRLANAERLHQDRRGCRDERPWRECVATLSGPCNRLITTCLPLAG